MELSVFEKQLTQRYHNERVVELVRKRLDKVYDNYFPLDQVSPIEDYLQLGGVKAGLDKKGNSSATVKIRFSPLRIEIKNLKSNTKRVAWQLNCIG